MSLRRTKIIATLGPATEGEMQVRALADSGINAVRLNFSHGNHNEHSRSIASVRAISAEIGRPIAVIADLQGPKIRVGEMPETGARLVRGQEVVLTSGRVTGTSNLIPISYNVLAKAVEAGSRVLLDDGVIILKVLEVKSDGDVLCRVTVGGVLMSKRGRYSL